MRSILLATYDADNVKNSEKVFGVEFDLADPFTMAWEARLVEALTDIKASERSIEIFFLIGRYRCEAADITIYLQLPINCR